MDNLITRVISMMKSRRSPFRSTTVSRVNKRLITNTTLKILIYTKKQGLSPPAIEIFIAVAVNPMD